MNQTMEMVIPMLVTEDVPASIAFYTEVLGFNVRDRMDDVGATGWAALECGPARVMLASSTNIPRSPLIDGRHQQVMHYFYPDDVDALYARVQESGWPASDVIVTFYGMKEFELVDPSGHVLMFGQDTNEPPTPGLA